MCSYIITYNLYIIIFVIITEEDISLRGHIGEDKNEVVGHRSGELVQYTLH